MTYTVQYFQKEYVLDHLNLLSPDVVLKRYSPEDVVKNYSADEILSNLSPESLKSLMEKLAQK